MPEAKPGLVITALAQPTHFHLDKSPHGREHLRASKCFCRQIQAVKANGIPQPFSLKFYLTLITASEIHYNKYKGAGKEKVVSQHCVERQCRQSADWSPTLSSDLSPAVTR